MPDASHAFMSACSDLYTFQIYPDRVHVVQSTYLNANASCGLRLLVSNFLRIGVLGVYVAA